MTDEFPKMSVDKARPGIIRYEGADELTGVLAGLHAPEIVRRCNSYPALLEACEAMVKARNPTGYVRAVEMARAAIAASK